MENRTQSAVPILSKKTKISNAGDAEEMGYIWVVCHLAFFFYKWNSSVLTNLNEVKRQQEGWKTSSSFNTNCKEVKA